ncbi:MAG: hypothetical protein ACE5GA_04960 [Candidatus Zixiibacteriota bacterium]
MVICLFSLIISGASPIYYFSDIREDTPGGRSSSLRLTASSTEALAAGALSLESRPDAGGEMANRPVSGPVNLWLIAGQSALSSGSAVPKRFGVLTQSGLWRPSSRPLSAVTRALALAGAEKRLEFTLLGLKPTGIS